MLLIIVRDSSSIHKTKRYDERGSPCLRPLVGVKLGRRRPFHKIDNDELETQYIINFIVIGGKPLWRRQDCRKSHLTLS
jgi:hypothetical protein